MTLAQESFLYKGIFVLLALPLSLPLFSYLSLLVPRYLSFGALFPKVIIFQMLVEGALGGYLLLLITDKRGKYTPFLTPTHFFLLIVGLVVAIAALISPDPHSSLFGSIMRSDGLLFLFHGGIYLFLLSWLIKEKRYFEFLYKISLLAGLSTLIFIPLLPLFLPTSEYGPIQYILGNVNFFAHYLILLSCISSYFILTKPRVWNALTLLVFLPFIIMTRSSTAFFISVFLCFTLAWVYSRKLFYTLSLIGLGIALYLTIKGNTQLLGHLGAWQGIFARGQVWRSAATVVLSQSPLVGFGWGNNEIMWNSSGEYYFSGAYGGVNELFDKMHNVFVEFLSGAGILGVITLLAFWGNVIFISFTRYRKRRDNVSLFFLLSFSLHLFFLLFHFDTLMSYILVSLLLSSFVFFYKERSIVLPVRQPTLALLTPITLVSMVFLFFFVNVNALKAYLLVERARGLVRSEDVNSPHQYQNIFTLLTSAQAINQPYDLLLEDIARTFDSLRETYPLTPTQREYVYQRLISLYKSFLQKHPFSSEYYYYLAREEEYSGKNGEKSMEYIQKALEIAPFHPLYRFHLGLLSIKSNELAKAYELFQRLRREGAYPGKVDVYLALIDIKESKLQEAKKKVITSLSLYTPTAFEWRQLTVAFLEKVSGQELLTFYSSLLPLNEHEVNLYVHIIRLAHQEGNEDLVQEYLREAEKKLSERAFFELVISLTFIQKS